MQPKQGKNSMTEFVYLNHYFIDHCLQVSNQCRDGGPISPSKCIYMKDWLAEL